MSHYCGLHRHTTYSFLDGFGRPHQIVERLKEIGQTACAITDHGSVFGHAEYNAIFRKNDIKPIFGCEFYHHRSMEEAAGQRTGSNRSKEERASQKIAHQTILAQNAVGYRNLLSMVTDSWQCGFHRKPGIDWDLLVRRQQGLIVLSGCVIGQLSQWINDGKVETAHQWAGWLKEHIEQFYIEIIPCDDLRISEVACQHLWEIARDLKIPTVITDDAHYPCAGDYPAQDAMLCVNLGKKKDDPGRMKLGPQYYYCSFDEIMARAVKILPHVPRVELEAACHRSVEIADRCNVELPKSRGPIFTVPGGYMPLSLLYDWILEGREWRRGLGLLPPEDSPEWKVYLQREGYELDIIHHHGFENYFLIVADLVRYCNANDYWCIARGSAGGSLICWYLGISQIDPIQFDLPVERFIDYSRSDMPDIDLDFDSRYRTKAFAYLTEKYGTAHCAHVAALSSYRARQAVRDIGKVYGVPSEVVDRLIALIPEKGNADEGLKAIGVLDQLFEEHDGIKAILEEYPDLRIAARLEGQLRQQTVHAAGFIVDSQPLTEVVAVVGRLGSDLVVSVDKEFAQSQGLLKIDVLSVDMLTVIAETLEMIGKDREWLYRLPLDDRPTYEMLAQGRNTGIFQLQGTAAGKLLPQVRAENFNEFAAVSALCRPGPLKSGGAQQYVLRKHGEMENYGYHPVINQFVQETYEVILYQEQVMNICRIAGGMDWPDVNKIRKLISKSGGRNALLPYKEKFDQGGLMQDIPSEHLDDIWEQCVSAGNYLFNAAHCKAYALIGYWTAYLKCHYPAQFTCAYARHETNDLRRQRMFQEFRAMGGRFILVSPNSSKETFSVLDDCTICGGFGNLRGIGDQLAKELVAAQPYRDWDSFLKYCPPNVRQQLVQSGVALAELDTDAVLTLAPWFIDIRLTENEREMARHYVCQSIGDLPDILTEQVCSRVRFMGRVTDIVLTDLIADAKKYGREPPGEGEPTTKAMITLADETGTCEIYFSSYRWAGLRREKIKRLFEGDLEGIGNTWIVEAAISQDRNRLFGENVLCVRHRGSNETPLPPGVARQRRCNRDELRGYELQERFQMDTEH